MGEIIDVTLARAEQLADMFLDDNVEHEYARLMSILKNDDVNLLTLELMNLKTKINELSLRRQVMELGKLSKIMSVCRSASKQFDEEEQLNTIKKFLELTTIMGEYVSLEMEHIAMVQSKVDFAVKYLIGKTPEQLEKNIAINRNVEKAYLSLKNSRNYDEALRQLIVDPLLYNQELLPSQDFEELIENNSKFIQSTVPENNLSLVESLLVYDKVLLRTFGTLSKALRFLSEVCDSGINAEQNEHTLWCFSTENLNELFKKFDENDLKNNTDLKKWQTFSHIELRSIRNRVQSASGYLDNTKETLVDSSELEEDFLMNIITKAPHQLKTFVDFLVKEKARVPLAQDRLPFYLNELVKVADNKTIKNTFIVEHGSEINHIDKYRKDEKPKSTTPRVYTRVRTKNKDK